MISYGSMMYAQILATRHTEVIRYGVVPNLVHPLGAAVVSLSLHSFKKQDYRLLIAGTEIEELRRAWRDNNLDDKIVATPVFAFYLKIADMECARTIMEEVIVKICDWDLILENFNSIDNIRRWNVFFRKLENRKLLMSENFEKTKNDLFDNLRSIIEWENAKDTRK